MSKSARGFTLVELLVVISIIAILAIIGLTIFSGVQKGARDARRRGDIDAVAKALEVNKTATGYVALNGSFFSSGQIPYDPLEPSVTVWPPQASGCGNPSLSSTNGDKCFYCFKADGANPDYCVTADWLLSDWRTSRETKWIICANLETGTPAYYCRGSQQ